MERISWRVLGQLILHCLELPVAAVSLVPTSDKSLSVEGEIPGDPNKESPEFSESITVFIVAIVCMHTVSRQREA